MGRATLSQHFTGLIKTVLIVQYMQISLYVSPRSLDQSGNGCPLPNSVLITVQNPESREQEQYRLVPRMLQQEFIGNAADNPYWEGACWVYNEADVCIGKAYLELAVYGGDMGKLIH